MTNEERRKLITDMESVERALDEDCLGGAYTFQEHDCRCKWETAYYHDRNRDKSSVEKYQLANEAGCDCGLWDERDRCVKALETVRRILAALKEAKGEKSE